MGLVLHILSGDLWGGAEAQVGLQLPALSVHGWRSEVLLFNEGEVARRYAQIDITTHVVSERGGVLRLARESLALTRRLSPKVLIAHDYKEAAVAYYLSDKLSIPWILWIHGVTESYRGWASVRMLAYNQLQMYLALRSAARVICVSKDAARRLGLADWEKARVIYNAAAVYDAPQSLDQSRSRYRQRPAIAVVGRLVPVKRIDRAIDAFDQCWQQADADSKPHLYLIGDGPLKAELESQSERLASRDNVHFLGFCSDALEYIREADILCLSSDSEGIPTVLLEALAAQVPVVSTAVGGIPEVCAHFPDYPVVLTELDATALAGAMQQILQRDHPKPDSLRTWRQVFSDTFSPAQAAARLHTELQEVLATRAK